MRVTVRVYGHLVADFEIREAYLDLPEGSTLGVMLDGIAGNTQFHVADFWLREDGLHILVDRQDWRLLGGRDPPCMIIAPWTLYPCSQVAKGHEANACS